VKLCHVKSACTLLALLLPFLAVTPLHAAEQIVVRSASAELRDGELQLTVRASFPADEEMRTALLAGATVDLDLQATVAKRNDYWFDDQLVEANFRRELSWNAPSQRFVLRDVDSGQQRTFATLEEALDVAGRVDGWPVMIEQQLDPGETYEAGVRARLRRGRMPSALRALTFWTRYWSRSEWDQWELPR
jgi:hypothetical protein